MQKDTHSFAFAYNLAKLHSRPPNVVYMIGFKSFYEVNIFYLHLHFTHKMAIWI